MKSSFVLPPNTKSNHKWQNALASINFESPINSLDLHTFSPDRTIGFTGEPLETLSHELQGTLANRSRKPRREALGCALYALAQAALMTTGSDACGVLHAEGNAGGKQAKRYSKSYLSATGLTKEFKMLAEAGWVVKHQGFRGKGHAKGLATLWLAAPPFIDWLETNEEALEVSSFSSSPELVVLKSNGQLADYAETEETLRIREHLKNTNAARLKHQWAYMPIGGDGRQYLEDELRTLPEAPLICRRVFNDDFQSGGRFYCPAQSLRKVERSTLLIDGDPTIELDYKSLHPRMLYNLNGLPAPADCYDPNNKKTQRERKLAKQVCMMVINCDNRSSAVKALVRQGVEHKSAERAAEGFEEDHKAISHEFYRSGWKTLQFMDSQLVERVLDVCLEEDIPVLPVHDSFISRTQDSPRMNEIIRESYRELLGFDAVISFGEDTQENWDWLERELALS